LDANAFYFNNFHKGECYGYWQYQYDNP
jgi:hypothetical protein